MLSVAGDRVFSETIYEFWAIKCASFIIFYSVSNPLLRRQVAPIC